MVELIEANWIALALAFALGLIVAWWLYARATKVGERSRSADVLDEGAAPAQRNQALIDAPSAAAAAITPPPMAGAMAGIGQVIAVGAQDVVEAADEAAAAASAAASADDLTRIKGLGPKLAVLLNGLGIARFAQIASWDEAEIDRIDAQLGVFAGRIRRDNWTEQARYLSAGDVAGFEAKFGKV